MNLTTLKLELAKVNGEISNVNDQLNNSNQITFYGALFLLIGLFMEVIGAVLLSGSELSEKTAIILDPKVPTGSTVLEFKSTKENVMGFYGTVALPVLGRC